MGKWTDTGASGLAVGTLPAIVTPASTDGFIVDQGGVTKRQTRSQLHTLETGEQLGIANGSKTALSSRFTFDTDTGTFLQGTNTQSFVCGGFECLRLGTVSGGVNHMFFTPGGVGTGPKIATVGPETNIDLLLSPKGTGKIVANGVLETVGPTAGTVGGHAAGHLMVKGNGTSQFSSAVVTGHNSFNGNTQLWYFGSVASGNDNIALINRQNASLSLWTNNASRLNISSGGQVTISDLGTGDVQATGGVLSVTSDARLKTRIRDFSAGLDVLLKIRPKTYQWNEKSGLDTELRQTGFVAQDLIDVLPEAVTGSEEEGYGLNSKAILGAAVNAIRELEKRVVELEKVGT